MIRNRFAVFAAALTLAMPMAAAHGQITIGVADPTYGNCIPFGCTPGTRYQQVYAASNFSGLTTINQISFFFTQAQSDGNTLATGTYQFFLSTTSTAVGSLGSASNSNLGLDNASFGTYTLSGVLATTTLSFLGTSFVYDPNQGNLLLDIQVSGNSANNFYGLFLDNQYDSSGKMSRAYQYLGYDEADGSGLVTQFANVSTVPEPSTYALMAAGLAALGFVSRRRRRALTA